MPDYVQDRARPEIFKIKDYVPGKPIDEVKRELGVTDIIKLASNENALGPSPLAQQAMREALDTVHLYPDSNCYHLKQKLARIYDLDPRGIVIGNGSDELLKMLADAFLMPGDEVVLAQPTFSEYEITATVLGAECIKVPFKNQRHDLEGMVRAVNNRTKIIYVCNPNNPTGTALTGQQLEQFLSGMSPQTLVVFDEAYFEYVDDPAVISGLNFLGKTPIVVLHTFSKIYGLAGMRVGYALTTPDIARAMEKVKDPFNVNLLAQKAAEAALDDSGHLERTLEMNRVGKQFLYDGFDRLGLNYVDSQANFILVDLKRDCREVFERLLKRGVIIRPADVFDCPTFIRVTIGTREENQRFIEELSAVLGEG